MTRISTGVPGIDDMVEKGIPENSVIGVSGPPGVGKSILAMQFIFDGARKNEKSVYINLEEPRENVDRTISSLSFGKEFFEHEKSGRISIVCLNYEQFESAYQDFFKKIGQDKKVKRLAIDSFNCFFSYLNMEKLSLKSGYETRKILSESFSLFRKKDFTTLLVLESNAQHNSEMNYYVEYMVDGIIHLDYISLGSIERRIFIPKMRWTNQHSSSLIYDITGKGLKVHKETEE